jgi:MFS family permease
VKATVAHATVVAAVGVLPTFLVGTLVVQLRADLGVGVGQIGIATAALFTTSALTTRFGASIVDRIGSGWAMTAAPLVSTIALLIGAAALSFPMLVVAMVVGGLGNAVAQPVANQRLSEFVRHGRLGSAFGVKQAAVPAAALFAGIAVPTIAISFGWRWVWIAAAAAAAIIAGIGFANRHRASTDRVIVRPTGYGVERLDRRTMMLITVGAFLAATVGTSIGVFFVDSAVVSGFGAGVAGALYAAFSGIGIITRIALGWWSDRKPRQDSYQLAALLLTLGVIGATLIAVGDTWEFFVGGFLAYVLGWAWPGLLHFAITRDNRSSVAAATGFLQTGSSLGAGLGPLFFGFVFAATSFSVGWLIAAALGVGAATLLALGSLSAGRRR